MMADDVPAPFSLKRWSRRKLEAAHAPDQSPPTPPAVAVTTGNASATAAQTSDASSRNAVAFPSPDLPAVESLTLESDFSAFLQPKVDEALKRQALKKLFSDPHFNVMDGLDTYIDDYSLPDPISADVVRDMVQSRYIFDPPKTRINPQGFVEDVPAEETAALQTDMAAPEALDSADSDAAVLAAPSDAAATQPRGGRAPAVDPSQPASSSATSGDDESR